MYVYTLAVTMLTGIHIVFNFKLGIIGFFEVFSLFATCGFAETLHSKL